MSSGAKDPECKRCLFDSLAIVREAIIKQLAEVPPAEQTPDGEHDARLEVCRKCQYLMGETCAQCGSFATVRAARRHMSCPKGLW